jgi:hypothetical protein
MGWLMTGGTNCLPEFRPNAAVGACGSGRLTGGSIAGLLNPAAFGSLGGSCAGARSRRSDMQGFVTAESPEGISAGGQDPSQSTRKPSKQSRPGKKSGRCQALDHDREELAIRRLMNGQFDVQYGPCAALQHSNRAVLAHTCGALKV